MYSSDSNYNRLADFASAIRTTTLKRLEEVPYGFLNWRLNNTAMSFVGIVKHLTNVDELFFSITTTNNRTFKWTLGVKEPHIIVDVATFNTMINVLKDNQLKRYAIIKMLDETKLNEVITDDHEQKMTLWQFIMHKLIEHEIYHRGQIGAYLKVLKGESSEL